MSHGAFIANNGSGLSRAASAGGFRTVGGLLEGHDVRCLAADLRNADVVYASTESQGVLRSREQGGNWEPAGMACQIVKSLAVSSHEPSVLYAGTKSEGVCATRYGDIRWDELEAFRHIRGYRFWRSPSDPRDWRAHVQALAVSPTDPAVLVAGIEFSLSHETRMAGAPGRVTERAPSATETL